MTYFECPEFLSQEGIVAVLSPLPGPLLRPEVNITLMHNPTLSQYSRHPVLTRTQEHHLFRQYNYWKFAGDLAEAVKVRNEIVGYNYRLVISVWDRFHRRADTFDDYVQNGILTLLRCVDGFDYRRGLKFGTYAFKSLRCALLDLDRILCRHYTRFESLRPSVAEEIEDFREINHNTNGGVDEEVAVRRAVKKLPPRMQETLRLRFFEGLTYAEIGRRRGVTKQAAALAVTFAVNRIGRHLAHTKYRG